MDKAYAKALWNILEGGAKPKGALNTLHESLKARGRLGLLPKIARAFALIAARAEAKNVVVLKVARKSDSRRALNEAGELLKDAGVRPSDVKIDIQENLIGGWRLEGRERLHDASHKAQLMDIYERVSEG
ncbi:hypothetical protein A3C86_01910 [Candidatus Kaiserbacteria bacterium RIFCSPHIGHO2_02_FULL_49_16]|uniref:Uncharacterized protein n=1 Tax=Candidatus Kaiserbacteria bacterium RIFCSPHIGHO2_02_FULL_49_16 TaxID=1798490 RepID=A0A1F6DEF6_9BACT|nr:MAG: hypothetical protein A3C86_01910 [Candidatus Kaiserbacteria bacterium RIFCSPHIGHO2_02_FULL_49_16]